MSSLDDSENPATWWLDVTRPGVRHLYESLPVEGVYHPHIAHNGQGIRLRSEWLGQTCLTRIGGNYAEVSLPRIDPAHKKHGPSAPPKFSLLPPDYEWSASTFPTSSPEKWGNHTSHSNQLAFIRDLRVAVDTGQRAADEVADQVHEEIGHWWHLVKSWIELLSSQDLEGLDRFHGSNGTARLWLEVAPGQVKGYWPKSRLANAWRPEMGFGYTHYWAVAVYAAGFGIVPPLPWVILRQALRAFENSQFRRTVIECAIASELALTQVLTERRKLPLPPNRDGTEQQNPMLGKLVRMEAAGPQPSLLPEDFYLRVVKPRNDVMHDGYSPASDEAVAAFALTRDLVEAVLPRTDLTELGVVLRTDPSNSS